MSKPKEKDKDYRIYCTKESNIENNESKMNDYSYINNVNHLFIWLWVGLVVTLLMEIIHYQK